MLLERMKIRISIRTLIIITALSGVIIVGALLGWYVYLKGKGTDLSLVQKGRGLGETLASSFPVGSAYQNVTNAIGGIFGGPSAASSTTPGAAKAPTVWQFASAPTAGMGFFTSASSSIGVRFVDRASGNIFDAELEKGSVVRRSNTLVPKISYAVVAPQYTIMQTEGSAGVETYLGTIKAATTTSNIETAPGTLSTITLPRTILAITVDESVAKGSLFYLLPYNGGIAGMLMKGASEKSERIWTFPITGWLAAWSNGHITLVQKPSGNAQGSAYRLSLSGSLSPIVSNVSGLFLREHPKNNGFLYSSVSGKEIPKLVGQIGKNAPINLPFATLADKCAWDPSSDSVIYCGVPQSLPDNTVLPDAWYRGEVHFSDAIWRMDIMSGAVHLVYDPSRDNQQLDILDPQVSADGSFLIFTDAATQTGWSVRLK